MRYLFGALVKICAPDVAPGRSQRAHAIFEKREWDKKSQHPRSWRRDFRLDPSRQGRTNLNGLADARGKFGEFLESARRSLRIHDMRAQERPAAIEFEIEIAATR